MYSIVSATFAENDQTQLQQMAANEALRRRVLKPVPMTPEYGHPMSIAMQATGKSGWLN